MNRIKENLNYITSQEDNDKEKFEKIFKKMNENGIELRCSGYEIESFHDGYTLGKMRITLSNEEVVLPFVVETSKFSMEALKAINEAKKFIVFERLGILHKAELTQNQTANNSQGASSKQIGFIRDKMKYGDSKTIVEEKLKEYGKTLENISKDEASAIITALGRR